MIRRVEPDGFAEKNADVLLSFQDIAKRRGDIGRRKSAGGNLIEERLEKVEVAAVDQRDVNWRVFQRDHGAEAAESSADDDHTMPGRHSPLAVIPLPLTLA